MNHEVAPGQSRRKRNLVRSFGIAVLLVAPMFVIPYATRRLVDHAAARIADVATQKVDDAVSWRNVGAPIVSPPTIDEAPREVVTFADPASARIVRLSGPTSSKPAKSPRGIVVRADTVARAVHSGGRPSGVFTPANGSRPAGLSLVGVSGFGTALRDGDILTSVGGTPATSVGAVVGAVAGAIGHGAKVITGVVWRGDDRIDVAVEIPGPNELAKAMPKRRKSVANEAADVRTNRK